MRPDSPRPTPRSMTLMRVMKQCSYWARACRTGSRSFDISKPACMLSDSGLMASCACLASKEAIQNVPGSPPQALASCSEVPSRVPRSCTTVLGSQTSTNTAPTSMVAFHNYAASSCLGAASYSTHLSTNVGSAGLLYSVGVVVIVWAGSQGLQALHHTCGIAPWLRAAQGPATDLALGVCKARHHRLGLAGQQLIAQAATANAGHIQGQCTAARLD
eukprot:scaffold628_cov401-Prasinococcus_capsulatus_cf.AAC.7